MKVCTYYRVSSKAQEGDDKYGLPKQYADVAAYIKKEQHEVVASFEDVGYSGATADRPQLAALMEATGFEAVVVPCWDRLARDSTLDGYLRYVLESRGIKVLSATQSNDIDPIAKLTQGILAAVAGYERHMISQRMMGAKRLKAARGGYAHGQPAYGWQTDHNGNLSPRPDELPAIDIMKQLRGENKSYRAIADALNKTSFRPRKAQEWNHVTVRSILSK